MHSSPSSSKSLSLSHLFALLPSLKSFFRFVCLFGLCFWQEAKQQQQAAQGQ
jgi:hypothetical protein